MTSSVYIAKTVYGGDGLGRLGDGRVVFVPGAWMGEEVKAEIVSEKKNFVNARLVSVDETSPDRIDGGALVGIPGCVYANLSYAGELKAKQAQLEEFLTRARINVPSLTNLKSDLPMLNYRNKVVYHFARQDGAWAIGYRTEPSHRIIDIENDPLAAKPINDKLPEIRKSVLALLTTGPAPIRKEVEQKGNVTIRWSARTGVKWWIGDAPNDVIIKEDTCGKIFEVPAGGFYQVNPAAAEVLVKAVVDEYAKGAAETPNLLDLYCGVGVFGLCCRPQRLTGVESGRQAIDFAKRNAASQGVVEAKFYAEQVGRNLRQIKVGSQTAVIVDPPRGGLEQHVPEWLAQSKAPRIFYVSCDPATLMRDLRIITRGYSVESVSWINMFPRTARFETLVVLKKK